jgi:hypothetical protein
MASGACGIAYVDVSMVDHVVRRVCVRRPGGEVLEKQRRDEVPEDILMAARSKRGDLDGKVTVSATLADNIEYGYKAEAFVSISLACENTIEACQEVHDILQPVVHALVRQDHAMAASMRDDLLNPKSAQEPVGGQIAQPPSPSQEVLPTQPRFVR